MARQGSLCQDNSRYRCVIPARLWVCAVIASLFCFCQSPHGSAATPFDSQQADVRVEFDFAAPQAKRWALRLRLTDSQGRRALIDEIRNLSKSESTSGIFELAPDGMSLTIQSRHAVSMGRVQFRIRAAHDATLTIESPANASADTPQFEARELPVAELMKSETIRSDATEVEGSSGPGWTIRRSSGDWIRTTGPEVYQPGTNLDLSVRANGMLDHASRSLVMHCELYRVGRNEIVTTQSWPIQIDAFGNSEALPVSEQLPGVAGVYEVRLRVETEEETIWTRLRRRPDTIAHTARPIVILHGGEPVEQNPEPWRVTGVIRPSESNWSMGQWLPKPTTRLIPGASSITPAEVALESAKHDDQAVSVLAPNQTFQATLPVRKPGYPHKVTLRFPSDTRGRMRVQIGKSIDNARTDFVIEEDSTADQQSPWRELTVVHYPVEDDQVWLTNVDDEDAVAFESLSVEAGPLHLAESEQPLDGDDAQTPSLESRPALLRLSEIDWPQGFTADVSERTDRIDCDPATIAIHDLWVATERLADHVRGMGFTGVVLPANSGARALYESEYYAAISDQGTVHRNHLSILLQLLAARGISARLTLQPSMLLTDLEREIQIDPGRLGEMTRAQASSRVAQDSLGPESGRSGRRRLQYSALHPDVQNSIGKLVHELNELGRQHPNFAGVIVDCEGRSHLHALPETTIDFGAVILFARSTRPSRSLTEVRTWVHGKGRAEFLEWQRIQELQSLSRIANSAPDTMLLAAVEQSVGTTSARPPERPLESTTNLGDGSDAANNAGVVSAATVQSYRFGSAGISSRQSSGSSQRSSSSDDPSVVLLASHVTGDARQVVRSQLLSDVAQLIGRVDPMMLVLDYNLVQNYQNDALANLVASFCKLPNLSMREMLPIDSASRTVQLRKGTIGGRLYITLTGLAPWASDVDLDMSGPTHWELVGRVDDPEILRPLSSSGGTRHRVTVGPGRVVVLRTPERSRVTVRSWTTRVSGGPSATESIKQKVTSIVERIGILQEFQPSGQLANGGFEQAGGMGLVGWMHAQHPPECVQVDDQEFSEGKRSVVMTTKAPTTARTWIVSETLDPPQSGRLAVSLACRAEAAENQGEHGVRVSIEATRHGDPIRFTRDISVPRNGQWLPRDVVLEVEDIDDTDRGSLRLTLDSLSGGRVWIDDVQLHDHFPTTKERDDLQSLAFLAVQGLQRGNVAPSGRLLQNHWARYLLTLGPIEQSKRVIEAVPTPPEEPGVAERIRSWLPRPLRF